MGGGGYREGAVTKLQERDGKEVDDGGLKGPILKNL
jgi:hypothetical protein